MAPGAQQCSAACLAACPACLVQQHAAHSSLYCRGSSILIIILRLHCALASEMALQLV